AKRFDLPRHNDRRQARELRNDVIEPRLIRVFRLLLSGPGLPAGGMPRSDDGGAHGGADATQPTVTGQSKSPQNQARSESPKALSARQAEADAGATEVGALDGERAGIKLDGIAHHGEAEPVARHTLIAPHAALEHSRPIPFGDTGSVVLDDHFEAMFGRGC